jgi:hypothetical protein
LFVEAAAFLCHRFDSHEVKRRLFDHPRFTLLLSSRTAPHGHVMRSACSQPTDARHR